MHRILRITTILIFAISCGQNPKESTLKTFDQLQKEFVDVMLDSTVSWAQVTDVIYPFVDSLCTAASDETNLSNRLFGQEMGYLTIELMNDKYANLKEDGYNVDHNDVNKDRKSVV